MQIEHDDDEQYHEDEDHEDGDQFPHQPVAPEYKSLIAISAKKGKGELSDSLKSDPHKVTRLSLSEQVLVKAVVSHGPEIIRYLQRRLCFCEITDVAVFVCLNEHKWHWPCIFMYSY